MSLELFEPLNPNYDGSILPDLTMYNNKIVNKTEDINTEETEDV